MIQSHLDQRQSLITVFKNHLISNQNVTMIRGAPIRPLKMLYWWFRILVQESIYQLRQIHIIMIMMLLLQALKALMRCRVLREMYDFVHILSFFSWLIYNCVESGSDSDISMGSIIPVLISAATATTLAQFNMFKTEYHPHSGHAPIVESFSVYGTRSETTQSPVIDDKPWQPFSYCADFEFTKLVHKAALSKEQTNELLKFIWRVANGHTKFTFKTHNDVSAAWTRASCQMTPLRVAWY